MQQLTQHNAPLLRCPLCRDDLETAPHSLCPDCETSYHSECADEFGGCATLGCAGRTPVRRRSRTAQLPAWRREELRRQVREETALRHQRRLDDAGSAQRVAQTVREFAAERQERSGIHQGALASHATSSQLLLIWLVFTLLGAAIGLVTWLTGSLDLQLSVGIAAGISILVPGAALDLYVREALQ